MKCQGKFVKKIKRLQNKNKNKNKKYEYGNIFVKYFNIY